MPEFTAEPALILLCTVLGVAAGLSAEKVAQKLLPELHTEYQRRTGFLVAAIAGVLSGAMAWRFGPDWLLPAFLFLVVTGVVLSRIDLQHQLLPNILVIPSLLMAFVLLLMDAAASARWGNLLLGLLGSAVMFAIYLVLAIISPRSLGMGDVKLAAVLGFYLGYLSMGLLVLGMVLGFVVLAVTGGALVIVGLAGRKSSVPFGPAMVSGTFIAILFGSGIGRVVLPSLFI